ncbi:amidohydrolase family protein [Neobacillus drentensis]|uniref:amidohydrolase family protein n=1 Tax=Neobacillus drentensis TaxID=220684 RepID=UPI0030017502
MEQTNITAITEKDSKEKTKGLPVIDCDLHEAFTDLKVLFPYLDEQWREYIVPGSWRPSGLPYGRLTPGGYAMVDAWPENGTIAGSDYSLFKKQLLDKYNVKKGILTGIFWPSDSNTQPEFKNALATAYNDWQSDNWLKKDKRLLGSIHVNCHDPIAAAEEIDRAAKNPQMIQVMISVIPEALGKTFYHPIYEAAERNNLPIGFHLGSAITTVLGNTPYFTEWYALRIQNYQSIMANMIVHGVFEKFPKLKVMMIEGGFSWVVPLMWRLDATFRTFRREVPWLKRLPSEYIRDHFKFTTQPMDDPDPKHLMQMIEMLGPEMLCFASDYPHWDFDDPYRAFPTIMPNEWKQRILYDNARDFYRLEDMED